MDIGRDVALEVVAQFMQVSVGHYEHNARTNDSERLECLIAMAIGKREREIADLRRIAEKQSNYIAHVRCFMEDMQKAGNGSQDLSALLQSSEEAMPAINPWMLAELIKQSLYSDSTGCYGLDEIMNYLSELPRGKEAFKEVLLSVEWSGYSWKYIIKPAAEEFGIIEEK